MHRGPGQYTVCSKKNRMVVVQYKDESDGSNPDVSASRVLRVSLAVLPTPRSESEALDAAVPESNDARKRAFEIKRVLTDIARKRLPSSMGDRYTKVVVLCLTCLDKDGEFGSPDNNEDAEGIQVGVRYIKKVGALASCNVIVLTMTNRS